MRYFVMAAIGLWSCKSPPLLVASAITQVAPSGDLTIQFSREPDARSLDERSLYLQNGPDGMLTHWQGSSIVAFHPLQPLAPDTRYVLVITRRLKDLEGRALAADEAIPFSTGHAVVASAPLPADSALQ